MARPERAEATTTSRQTTEKRRAARQTRNELQHTLQTRGAASRERRQLQATQDEAAEWQKVQSWKLEKPPKLETRSHLAGRGTPTEPEKRTLQEQAHGTEAQEEEEKGKQRADEQGQQRVVDRINRTQQSRKSNRRLGSERRQKKTPRCHQEEETRTRKERRRGQSDPARTRREKRM